MNAEKNSFWAEFEGKEVSLNFFFFLMIELRGKIGG